MTKNQQRDWNQQPDFLDAALKRVTAPREVDDAAVARVREAGGTVIDEPSQQAYGKSALCTDDQGSRFYLGEL